MGGAAFQTLFSSFKKEARDRVVLPLLRRSLPLVVDLEHLAFGLLVGIVKFRGEPFIFIAFHTSVSFICKFKINLEQKL